VTGGNRKARWDGRTLTIELGTRPAIEELVHVATFYDAVTLPFALGNRCQMLNTVARTQSTFSSFVKVDLDFSCLNIQT